MAAERAWSDAFLYADNLATIEAIRGYGKEWMSCGQATASSRSRVG